MRLHFEQGDIAFLVNSDQRGVQYLALSNGRHLQGRGARGLGEDNANPLCTLDDVSIGEDVALGIDNHTRSDLALMRDRDIATISFLDCRSVSRDRDLNHGLRNTVRERDERRIELPERVGSM